MLLSQRKELHKCNKCCAVFSANNKGWINVKTGPEFLSYCVLHLLLSTLQTCLPDPFTKMGQVNKNKWKQLFMH